MKLKREWKQKRKSSSIVNVRNCLELSNYVQNLFRLWSSLFRIIRHHAELLDNSIDWITENVGNLSDSWKCLRNKSKNETQKLKTKENRKTENRKAKTEKQKPDRTITDITDHFFVGFSTHFFNFPLRSRQLRLEPEKLSAKNQKSAKTNTWKFCDHFSLDGSTDEGTSPMARRRLIWKIYQSIDLCMKSKNM